jgi:hypothetical protein
MSAAPPAVSGVAHRPRGFARFTPLLALPVPVAWFVYTLAFNPTDPVGDPTGPCTWHARSASTDPPAG